MPNPVDKPQEFLTEQAAKSTADFSWDSPFHTIGKGPTQAAAGNHKHTEYPTKVEVEDQYVKNIGDATTGNLEINGTTVGKVWEGSYDGVQPAGPRAEGPALLFGRDGSPTSSVYLIGNSNIILRPLKDSNAADVIIYADGTIRGYDPIDPGHLATKRYVDKTIQGGSYTIPQVASNTTCSPISIVYPIPFPSTPNLVLTGGSSRLIGCVNSNTASGATIQFSNWTPAATPGSVIGYWIAMA